MKTLGICFGATTLQAVILEEKEIQSVVRIPHEGNPKKIFLDFLASINLSEIDKIAVTGRNFRKNVRLSSISEPVAIEQAIKAEYPESNFPDFIISAGGETQLAYKISKHGDILSVHSGNKCASGTGEFFLQQIGRMNLPIDEAIKLAANGTPHKIAGRCSVFCKSDCTHALNKGEPKENVIAGLCHMMVDRMLELFKDRNPNHITFIGGGSLNPTLVNILSERMAKVDVPKLSGAFEAYGAALWAMEHECLPITEKLFNDSVSSFGFHEPLNKAASLVTFKEQKYAKITAGETYILGLDVGSTTTKAVLMNKDTQQIAASVYGRTNGNPIAASKYCYTEIKKQIGANNINIIALGVTGSGRQIAALHALSKFVINEIIAHATAAAYFDPEVDTIFEIGGQDAKYTYLTNGVPSDYAMNEACSAGTGSFLEESAKESLNVKTEDIGVLALQGENPPNFTDQCAAFISSDIKRAGQEGISKNNILAGLVYSICLNYTNRVKESRPIGKKIFMQGGVCYNKAVPIAMASLIKTPIIVPPDPGLMGAFGVALEVKKQLELGLMKSSAINLDELINREAKTIGTFICAGGKEKCDRKCEIAKIDINGEIHPFGGACDRYYNLRLKNVVEPANFDYVAIRQELLFKKYVDSRFRVNGEARTIGIMNSFLTHSLAPLYVNFFHALGLNIVFSDKIDPAGIARIESAFCLPAEISHGSFLNLINKQPDYIFLPHIMELPVANAENFSKTCVFVQGEPYYLRTTFRCEIERSNTQILSPILNMREGYEKAQSNFISIAKNIGITKKLANEAFNKAVAKQHQFEEELLTYGKKALAYLDEHPETFGIALLGRPYNAFTDDANMGIPHKVASRGFIIIPFDMLPIADQCIDKKIYWAMGQKIMKAVQLIKQRENLFGFFITNFSCGPDSFILNYFRTHMGMKPSLTLELDQHTADAGIDTRIEAALTIMKSYRSILGSPVRHTDPNYQPAKIIYRKNPIIISSSGIKYSLQDPQVELIFPSMGKLTAEGLAVIFESFGIKSRALPIPDKDVLLEGKKNSLCKECLPYMLTTGSFMTYLKQEADPNKIKLLFLVTGEGPCRLGQYCKALENVIIKNKIPNVAVFTLTDENGYAGLGGKLLLRSWQGMLTLDVLNEIKSMLSVTAQNKETAIQEFDCIWQEILMPFWANKSSLPFTKVLTKVVSRLKQIPLKQDPKTVPIISLIGEIFVRQEEFSRQNIIPYLEKRGFMVKVAPISEYLCYINYLANNNISDAKLSFLERAKFRIISPIQTWWEKRIKSILATSGLYKFDMVNVDETIACAEHLINKKLMGEAILTTGLGLREILHDSCGVISIGPFGCMPSRLAESILRKEMNAIGKQRLAGWQEKTLKFKEIEAFPYLSIETDGNPFPQIIEANLEAFILQAKRLHDLMEDGTGNS